MYKTKTHSKKKMILTQDIIYSMVSWYLDLEYIYELEITIYML